ncbi:universal stress protein [Kitasatospora sp. NPDC090091]|uniref:universal stress protein n=1 Tax=Kitasatospora sp. NPDC090091 TaxID=3364081 RepID=UPI0037FED76C
MADFGATGAGFPAGERAVGPAVGATGEDDGGQSGRSRIVVGVSGSLGSLAALHRAVAEARRTDAEVLAVHCWTPPGGEIGYRHCPCPPLLGVCREAADARLRQALDEAFGGGHAGVRLRCLVVRGESGRALVHSADRPGDLLVLGAGRRGALARVLRPSVTAYCVRHATCPVLTVPRSALQRDLEALERRHFPLARPLGAGR